MKRGPKKALPISTSEVCSHGCGRVAKFKNATKLLCEVTSNKCPAVKAKNAKAVSLAHTESSIIGWPLESRRKGAKTTNQKATDRKEWYLADAPFDQIPVMHRKERILREQNNVCDICKCDPFWNGKPLVFQLDHKQGKQLGDSRENLRVICPNCHTQTETFCSKNRQSRR